jgi:hypothetical protein
MRRTLSGVSRNPLISCRVVSLGIQLPALASGLKRMDEFFREKLMRE